MKVDKEDWNDLKVFPTPQQKCKILVLREAIYIGKTKDGNHEFKVNEKGLHKVLGWKEIEGKSS